MQEQANKKPFVPKKPFNNNQSRKPSFNKRPREDHENSKGSKPGPAFKKGKSKPSLVSSLKSSGSKSSNTQGGLKKKLRDAQRLLKKNKIDAEARQTYERRVKALEIEISELEKNKQATSFQQKYRKVRLFESTKAKRNLKKIEKLLSSRESLSTDEIQSLETQLLNAQIDLNYTLYFPQDEKYISLFVSNNLDKKQSAKVNAQRQKIREGIQKKMLSGDLKLLPKKDSKPAQKTPSKTEAEQSVPKEPVVDSFFGESEGESSQGEESGSGSELESENDYSSEGDSEAEDSDES